MFFRSPYADALIVVLILLLFFGPKRLPALGKSLGEGMREFKDSITGRSKDSDEERPELGAAPAPPAVQSQAQDQQQAAPPAGVSAPAQPSEPEAGSSPRP